MTTDRLAEIRDEIMRRHVRYPEEGMDGVDAAIASAISDFYETAKGIECHHGAAGVTAAQPAPDLRAAAPCICPDGWRDLNTSHHPNCDWWREYGRRVAQPAPDLRAAAQDLTWYVEHYLIREGDKWTGEALRRVAALRAALEDPSRGTGEGDGSRA